MQESLFAAGIAWDLFHNPKEKSADLEERLKRGGFKLLKTCSETFEIDREEMKDWVKANQGDVPGRPSKTKAIEHRMYQETWGWPTWFKEATHYGVFGKEYENSFTFVMVILQKDADRPDEIPAELD